MTLHKLGNSGIEIAPLAFGGNVFGWTADEKTSFRLLDACVDNGINLIDTADVYTIWIPGHKGGESETVIGNWLKQSGKRNKIVIATKVGMEMSPTAKGLSRAHILRSVDASLRRLQTDVIDLYQSHQDDESLPLEETLGAYAELIAKGKVRAIGASNYSAPRLAEAFKVGNANNLPRYESLQPLYNLYDRAPYEDALEAVCEREKIGVIPYFSLASGFLTGKYRSEADFSKSPRGGGMQSKLDARGLRILDALDKMAKQHSATPAQIALAWLIARPSVTAPIVSASNMMQFDDLVASMKLKLDAASIKFLTEASV